MKHTKILLASTFMSVLCSSAFAQNMPPNIPSNIQSNRQELRQDIEKELGVTPKQLHNCMAETKLAPGVKHTKAEREERKVNALNCLHQFNASLTEQQLVQFMKTHHKLRNIQHS